MNGVDVIAEILKREGTEFLSCYPRNPLIEACAKIDIRPILCRQERVGVGIADGYSRINRGKRIGVFAAQAGPGIENAFPGIAQAYSRERAAARDRRRAALTRQYTRPVFQRRRNLPVRHQMGRQHTRSRSSPTCSAAPTRPCAPASPGRC